MIDLKLDPITHDLVIDNYDLQLIDDLEAVRQNIKQRLLHFLGEWFLDLEAGTPWIQTIFTKQARQSEVEAILKARIAGTPGVSEVVDFSLSADGERGLRVEFSAKKGDNTLTDSLVITI